MNLRYNVHNAFMVERKGALEPAPDWLAALGAKLAAKARMGLNRSWRFYSSPSPEPGLLATPYGTVIVDRGLLDLKLEREETAALLAHEMAHAAEDHGVKNLLGRMAKEGLAELGEEPLSEKSGQIARLKELLADWKYPLKQEGDADQFAMGMLKASKMAPEALVSALEKLGKAGAGEYLAVHPGLKLRLLAARKHLKELEAGAAPRLPVASGKPEIGRPTYMRRAMDEGYDYKKPLKKR